MSNRIISALICFTSLFAAGSGCDDGRETTDLVARTRISLEQQGEDQVLVRVAGPEGLRALQARLCYDPAQLTVQKVEAGEDAVRLDRLFFGDLEGASGELVVGLSDTRRVKLPARGALLVVTLTAEPSARLRLNNIVGARDGDHGAEGVRIADAELELGK